MNKWRQHVCLVVNDSATYPLRRIDASSLFWSINQVKATTIPREEAPLPRPCISFNPSCCRRDKGIMDFFGLFGLGQKKALLAAVDSHGVSLTYDVDDCIVNDIAVPPEPKCCESVSVALGDALYVMDSKLMPGRHKCFDALTFVRPKDKMCTRFHWDWRSLHPPPFMFEPGYKTTRVDAYTVVGGSSILISTSDTGTYSFDTVSSSWNKAGDWQLPIHGRADFIPEFGVWLGFSPQGNQLCYLSDLRAPMQHQPALDMVLDDDPNLQLVSDDPNPKRYTRILKSQLVHLGSGKFCVARFFERVENELTEVGCIPQVETFTALTGMELKSIVGRGIEMIPHKSILYRLDGILDCWVF